MADSMVEGVDDLVKKLNSLHTKMAAKLLQQSVGLAATPVVKSARMRIPVGSRLHTTYKGNKVLPGFAKRSIVKRTRIIDGKPTAIIGVKREAFYAVQFIEVGTVNMQAQPWLVPALEAEQQAVLTRLTDSLRKKIKKAVA